MGNNIDKIKEALSLLSAERVNTSGLGAPINILKRIVEDSEVESEVKSLSAEEYIKSKCSHPFPIDELVVDRHSVEKWINDFASMRVEQAKNEIIKKAQRMSNGVDVVLLSDIENL